MPLTVAILTPSTVLSGSLKRRLTDESDMRASVVVSETDIAIRQLRAADVALLDHRLPPDLLFRVLRTLRYLPGTTRAIITGAPRTCEIIARYLEHGAAGYVLEGESEGQLVDVVRQIGAGEARLDPWLAPCVIERYRELRDRMSAPRQRRNGSRTRHDGDPA